MDATERTMEALHAAYTAWWGKADAVLRAETDGAALGPAVPPTIDVLFFRQEEEEHSEAFVVVATAGMSTRTMPRYGPRVEFMLIIDGAQDWSHLHDLGAALATLAIRPFLEGVSYLSGHIIHDSALPLFEGRRHVLLQDVAGMQTALQGLTPLVFVLSVIPLYANEATVAASIGASETVRRSWAAGIDLQLPIRPPAVLHEFPPGLTLDALLARQEREEQPAAHPGDGADGVRASWEDIAAWCRAHAPRTGKTVRPGATEGQVRRLEALLSCLLPADYRASLRAHNGDADLSAWHYLSADGVWRVASALREQTEAGAFTGRTVIGAGRGVIQPLWWHRGWAPVAKDQGGRLLCLDLDPGLGGIVGQLIAWDPDTGPVATGHRSFAAWLREYRADLLAGRYHVDADGYIAAP